MLTEKQKKAFKRIVSFTLLLSVILLVTFRTISQSDLMNKIEILVKCVLLPVLMIAFSIRANIIKGKQVKANRHRSKVVNIMCYFPLIVFAITLALTTIHTLTLHDVTHKVYEVMGVNLWGFKITAFVEVAIILLVLLFGINKIVMKFKGKCQLVFDVFFVLVIIGLVVAHLSIESKYDAAYGGFAFYKTGDPILFIILLVYIFGAIFVGSTVKDIIDEDATLLNVDLVELSLNECSSLVESAEYNRAYQEILRDFEKYVAQKHHKDVEVTEAVELSEVTETPKEEEK